MPQKLEHHHRLARAECHSGRCQEPTAEVLQSPDGSSSRRYPRFPQPRSICSLKRGLDAGYLRASNPRYLSHVADARFHTCHVISWHRLLGVNPSGCPPTGHKQPFKTIQASESHGRRTSGPKRYSTAIVLAFPALTHVLPTLQGHESRNSYPQAVSVGIMRQNADPVIL